MRSWLTWIAWSLTCCVGSASFAVAEPSVSTAGQPASETSAAGWTASVERQRETSAGVIEERVWKQERPPGGRFDQIAVHRYRGSAAPIAALLYLPGTHMNGTLAVTDEDHNLWIFLARRGVDVYALDYRTHAVPVSPLSDTDAELLRGWSVETFVGDARAAAELIRAQDSGLPLFVAGFSRGVSIAYGVAYTLEPPLAGLVALDGSFKRYRPSPDFDAEAERARFAASGRPVLDLAGRRGWENRQMLMDRAAENPLAPVAAPAGDGSSESVGDQLAKVLQNAWGPGVLANPQGGRSSPRILARLLGSYDRYYPAVQNLDAREIAAVTDAPGTPIDDGFGESQIPVIYFGATGMGATSLLNGIYSASQSGSRDVTIHVLEDHGHLDVLVGNQSRTLVFEPVLEWIRRLHGAMSAASGAEADQDESAR